MFTLAHLTWCSIFIPPEKVGNLWFSDVSGCIKCGALRDLVPLLQFKNNLKNVKNTPPWVLFTFLKLHKWYQIAQRTTNGTLT